MKEMAPRFSKFFGGGGGGTPPDPPSILLGRSLAALGRAPWIITLQSIFETWQAWLSQAYRNLEMTRKHIRVTFER